MGKARGVVKYGLTGAITMTYGAAIYRILTGKTTQPPISKEKTAVVAGVVAVTTLLIAAL